MPPRETSFPGRAKPVHPHAWLWEPLALDPTFVIRPMFGTRAAYLGGKIVLCFCARHEPWRGILVATEREQHPGLLAEFPALTPHPILPKWLYLPESADAFERVAQRLVALARARDLRIGVVPRTKKKQRAARRKRRAHSRRP